MKAELSIIIMKKTVFLITALALAVFLLLPAAVSAPGTETMTIAVSSSPAGATAVYSATGERITTPGSFTIHGGTQYWGADSIIYISKEGYEPYYTQIYGSEFYDGGIISVSAALTPVSTDGELSVSSTPSDASVYVDGSYAGTTPLSITVDAGYHSVTIRKSGYVSWTGSTTVAAGQTAYLSGSLSPVTTYGYLSVSSSPSYADVYVSGVYKGETPLTMTLPAGTYRVEVKESGYAGYAATAVVTAGSTASINAALTPNPGYGYVNIASFPSGAAVYIDGTYVGNTQYSSSASNPNYMHAGPFTAGTAHTLMLKMDGYSTYSTSFAVSSGETKTFVVTMSQNPSQTTASLYITSTPSNAEVFIDNAYYGTTPAYIGDIAAGTHTVRVAASGYQSWEESSYFGAGQGVEKSVVLSPTPVPTPTATPVPLAGLIAALGAAAVVAAVRRM